MKLKQRAEKRELMEWGYKSGEDEVELGFREKLKRVWECGLVNLTKVSKCWHVMRDQEREDANGSSFVWNTAGR